MKWIAPLHNVDSALFLWCMDRKHRQHLTRFGRVVSRTGDGWLYILLFMGLWLGKVISSRMLLLVALAFSVERILYFVMKNGLRRNRPAQSIKGFSSFIQPHDKFSFPSGHTSAAFLTATLLTVIFPVWAAFSFVWAGLIGLSRVFLGVHFPGDILVGASLGIATAWMVVG